MDPVIGDMGGQRGQIVPAKGHGVQRGFAAKAIVPRAKGSCLAQLGQADAEELIRGGVLTTGVDRSACQSHVHKQYLMLGLKHKGFLMLCGCVCMIGFLSVYAWPMSGRGSSLVPSGIRSGTA